MVLVVAAVAAKHAVATSAESSAMARAVMGIFLKEQLLRRACPHQHRNVRETEMLDPKAKRLPLKPLLPLLLSLCATTRQHG